MLCFAALASKSKAVMGTGGSHPGTPMAQAYAYELMPSFIDECNPVLQVALFDLLLYWN